MRLVLILTAGLFLSLPAHAQPTTAEAIELSSYAVNFNPRDPSEVRMGRLRYLGGLVLRSPDRRFSGISGLRFLENGVRLIAITDRGYWISFLPTFEGERLSGAQDATIWPILDGEEAPLSNPAYDAESLTLLGDDALVGFERVHRIDRFAAPLGESNPPAEDFRSSDTFGARIYNESLEGLTTLLDGSVLALSEAPGPDGTMDGWLMDGETGQTAPLALLAVPPYRLTDLATLPNGNVVTLERRFSALGGIGVRLRLIKAEDIGPSTLLDGEELASWGAGYTIDNMEGLAVRTRDGRTELFLISDDNQNPLQRTILLAFELMAD